MQDTIFRLAYVARRAVIHWCLALANYLQRAQAHAITRAWSAKGQGLPAGVNIPAPTFPNPDRLSPARLNTQRVHTERVHTVRLNPERVHSPPPRVSPELFTQSATPRAMGRRARESELRYDEFDEAPTAVYNPIVTNEVDSTATYGHLATTQRGIAQGEVRITSK